VAAIELKTVFYLGPQWCWAVIGSYIELFGHGGVYLNSFNRPISGADLHPNWTKEELKSNQGPFDAPRLLHFAILRTGMVRVPDKTILTGDSILG